MLFTISIVIGSYLLIGLGNSVAHFMFLRPVFTANAQSTDWTLVKVIAFAFVAWPVQWFVWVANNEKISGTLQLRFDLISGVRQRLAGMVRRIRARN